MMVVNGNSVSNARSKFVFVFAKSAIFAQVCYICPSVLYFPEVWQIQHSAIKYGNKSTLYLLIPPTQSTMSIRRVSCLVIYGDL